MSSLCVFINNWPLLDLVVPPLKGRSNNLVDFGPNHHTYLELRAAGHSLMDQYPDKFNKILQTFLSTVK